MTKTIRAGMALLLVLSSVALAQATQRMPPTPKDQLTPLPSELQTTFDKFCQMINEPSTAERSKTIKQRLSAHVLPGAFHIEQNGYRERPWKDELNLPFFFHHPGWDRVWHITKLNADCFLINTLHTNLYFVRTSAGVW